VFHHVGNITYYHHAQFVILFVFLPGSEFQYSLSYDIREFLDNGEYAKSFKLKGTDSVTLNTKKDWSNCCDIYVPKDLMDATTHKLGNVKIELVANLSSIKVKAGIIIVIIPALFNWIASRQENLMLWQRQGQSLVFIHSCVFIITNSHKRSHINKNIVNEDNLRLGKLDDRYLMKLGRRDPLVFWIQTTDIACEYYAKKHIDLEFWTVLFISYLQASHVVMSQKVITKVTEEGRGLTMHVIVVSRGQHDPLIQRGLCQSLLTPIQSYVKMYVFVYC